MLRFISTTANTNIEEFVFNILRSFIFARIIFHGCKFCHISRGFIFADDEILIILRGLISAVARYVMFMTSETDFAATELIHTKINVAKINLLEI